MLLKNLEMQFDLRNQLIMNFLKHDVYDTSDIVLNSPLYDKVGKRLQFTKVAHKRITFA